MKRVIKKIWIPRDDLLLSEKEFVKKYGGLFVEGIYTSGSEKVLATVVVGDWLVGDFFARIEVSNCHAKLFLEKDEKEKLNQEELEKILEERGRKDEVKKLRELVESSVILNQSGTYPLSNELKEFLEKILAEIEGKKNDRGGV